jgi:hypothetical protein
MDRAAFRCTGEARSSDTPPCALRVTVSTTRSPASASLDVAPAIPSVRLLGSHAAVPVMRCPVLLPRAARRQMGGKGLPALSKSYGAESWLQRFAPRVERRVWTRRNRQARPIRRLPYRASWAGSEFAASAVLAVIGTTKRHEA